jgi:hypothetical protein
VSVRFWALILWWAGPGVQARSLGCVTASGPAGGRCWVTALRLIWRMMKTIVDDLPGNSHADPTDAGLSQTAGQMTSAEGDSLRALRTIIFKHDPGANSVVLRRILAPSGDFLWVCPDHAAEYDPGLPVLP